MADSIIPLRSVERLIYTIRGQKVMLSTHLAELYGVEVRSLVQAVKRNIKRFPRDFMFQLTSGEFLALRSHFVILERGRGKHQKYSPYAFTEQGVAMLSSVLKSERAIQVNIAIIRGFVAMREMVAPYKELAHKLDEIEKKYDARFREVFQAIRHLMAPSVKQFSKIGFIREKSND